MPGKGVHPGGVQCVFLCCIGGGMLLILILNRILNYQDFSSLLLNSRLKPLTSATYIYREGEAVHIKKSVYNSSHRDLKRILNEEQRTQYYTLISAFDRILHSHGVEYFIADGTLLGSYLFHDFIPWDEDIDAIIAWDDLDKVKEAFNNDTLRETYDICTHNRSINLFSLETLQGRNPKLQTEKDVERYTRHSDYVFKFFRSDSAHAGKYPWKWPFLDVRFYKQTAKGIKKT